MAQPAAAAEVPAAAQLPKKTPRERILLQIKSLHEGDDERTSISKMISWILRHGAKIAGVEQDPKDKWVKLKDLNECIILKEYSPEYIWRVIVDFNGKKWRYEIDEQVDGARIRARQKEGRQEGANRKDKDSKSTLRADAAEYTPAAGGGASPAAASAMAAYAAAAFQQNPWAYNPMMLMNPYWQMSAAAAAGKYHGRIKSFSVEKGFGFIDCATTFAQYKRDVFLHKAQIGDIQVGSLVQFSCEVNNKNMPQAKDVQLIGPPMPGGVASAGKGGKDGEGKGRGKGRGKGKAGKGGKDSKEGKGEKEDTNNDDQVEKADESAKEAAAPAEAKAE